MGLNPLAPDLDHILASTGIWESLRNAKIFITGGSGFVGTWLLESLAWANEQLGLNAKAVVLTRDPAAFRFRRSCLELLCGDATSFEFPEGEFKFVVHAATERAIDTFMRDVKATEHVLEFARTHATERLLFTSSGAVYGEQPRTLERIPESYEGAPDTCNTASAYAQAKRASEFLCASKASENGFSPVIARLFAFVGPHLPLNAHYAVGNFIGDALAGRPIEITGDGTPLRSYLYAADLAIWLWTLLVRGESAKPYNVGSGQPISIGNLARLVADVTGSNCGIKIAQEPIASALPRRYVPSVERALAQFGLRESISLEKAIHRTWRWHMRSLTEP